MVFKGATPEQAISTDITMVTRSSVRQPAVRTSRAPLQARRKGKEGESFMLAHGATERRRAAWRHAKQIKYQQLVRLLAAPLAWPTFQAGSSPALLRRGPTPAFG